MGKERETGSYKLARTRQPQLEGIDADWAADLNAQQLAAVSAPHGPVLVLAGAGSGKTRVITHRVAYLLSRGGFRPQNILLLTFTNKAAKSMLHRAEQVVGPTARDVTGGTFHHFANLQLRKYAKALGYQSNFTILDESDSSSVMKLCRSERGLDKAEKAFPSAKLLVRIDSATVNMATDLETLLTRRFPHLLDFYEEIQHVLVDYRARKFSSNQMGFDDLLVNLNALLTDHPKVRAAMARRFCHVLVDEYQDVNHLQASIVRKLYLGDVPVGATPASPESRDDTNSGVGAALRASPRAGAGHDPNPDNDIEEGLEILPGQNIVGATPASPDSGGDSVPPLQVGGTGGSPVNTGEAGLAPTIETPADPDRGLFVVGDDAQSIYSFRGADFRNIRSFHLSFPSANIFKLETNYRSVPQVLNLANAVMDDADPMFRKNLQPVKPSAEVKPLLLACASARDQAEFVAEQILQMRENDGVDYRQMAILYRAHNNRLEVELELTQRGIPFVVRGGLRFFEQAHIKDLLCYLVVMANGRDELAWQRMLQMCNRVGPKTISTVLAKLRGYVEHEGGMIGGFINNGAAQSARGQGKTSLIELQAFLRTLEAEAEGMPVADLVQRVLDERYMRYLELNFENWRQRKEDLDQLVVFATRFTSMASFLADIGLSTDISGSRSQGEAETYDPEEGAVTLSTVHQAKGLEWKVVFLIHVHDEVIPHRMTHGNADELDEERRLLYVAITRAEELLFMSFPQMTETRDFQRIINTPCRFLSEISGEPFDVSNLEWDG